MFERDQSLLFHAIIAIKIFFWLFLVSDTLRAAIFSLSKSFPLLSHPHLLYPNLVTPVNLNSSPYILPELLSNLRKQSVNILAVLNTAVVTPSPAEFTIVHSPLVSYYQRMIRFFLLFTAYTYVSFSLVTAKYRHVTSFFLRTK